MGEGGGEGVGRCEGGDVRGGVDGDLVAGGDEVRGGEAEDDVAPVCGMGVVRGVGGEGQCGRARGELWVAKWEER